MINSNWALESACCTDAAIAAYKTRSSIEVRNALPRSSLNAFKLGRQLCFETVKPEAYNLEGTKASYERLTRLVLLIAIAYTCSALKGHALKSAKQQNYVGRLRKVKQSLTPNSSFWLGLYGQVWVIGMEFLSDLVEKLMSLVSNKLPCFQRGLRAMSVIQQAF